MNLTFTWKYISICFCAAAAMVAVNLLSSARVILKLDNAYTEYSAQYLVDNACPKKEAGQGEMDHDCSKLTAKDCLEFVLKEGIPKGEEWPHLGCMFKPPSSYNPARLSMKGEVIEPKNLDEALKFFRQQPIGAGLHVFSPELDDHVGEEVKCCNLKILKISDIYDKEFDLILFIFVFCFFLW